MRYRLFATCKIVRGISRSTLCDLQRERYIFLPNEFVDLFNGDVIELDELAETMDDEELIEVKKYIEYLVDHQYLFMFDEDENDFFPPLSDVYQYPGAISNSIIEITDRNLSLLHSSKVIGQLLMAGCRNFELRIIGDFSFPSLRLLKQLINRYGKEMFSVDIAIERQNLEIDIRKFVRFLKRNSNVRSLIIFNPFENRLIVQKSRGFGGLALAKGNLNAENCGFISPMYFSMGIKTYTEGLNHNTCLNKKLSIDRSGNIKSCPSSLTSYGSILDVKIEAVLNINEYKAIQHITKSQIEVCKTCEFRMMCTDCRVFTENPTDMYSKPLKCSYNPETMTW